MPSLAVNSPTEASAQRSGLVCPCKHMGAVLCGSVEHFVLIIKAMAKIPSDLRAKIPATASESSHNSPLHSGSLGPPRIFSLGSIMMPNTTNNAVQVLTDPSHQRPLVAGGERTHSWQTRFDNTSQTASKVPPTGLEVPAPQHAHEMRDDRAVLARISQVFS